jgi:hypothetical protein
MTSEPLHFSSNLVWNIDQIYRAFLFCAPVVVVSYHVKRQHNRPQSLLRFGLLIHFIYVMHFIHDHYVAVSS